MKKILLALGTVTMVATPIVMVVSCGGHDELPGEKSTARSLLSGDFFTEKEIHDFNNRINAAQSVNGVSKIRHEIDAEIEKRRNEATILNKPEGDAILELKGFKNLTQEKIEEYINRIKAVSKFEDIQNIVSLAENENDKIETRNELKEWEVGYEKELNQDFFLLKDWNEGVIAMKSATTRDELANAFKALKDKKNSPSISFATKDGWIIDAEEAKSGVKLYIPNNSKGTKVTWTDVSSANHQKTVVYEVTGLDNSGYPVVSVTTNGQLGQTPATVDKVDAGDYGIVLTDFSGSYHVSGVKELGKFEINKDIIQFLLNSKPVMESTSARLRDIKGMETILQSFSTTSATYKNIDVVDGKISLQ